MIARVHSHQMNKIHTRDVMIIRYIEYFDISPYSKHRSCLSVCCFTFSSFFSLPFPFLFFSFLFFSSLFFSFSFLFSSSLRSYSRTQPPNHPTIIPLLPHPRTQPSSLSSLPSNHHPSPHHQPTSVPLLTTYSPNPSNHPKLASRSKNLVYINKRN